MPESRGIFIILHGGIAPDAYNRLLELDINKLRSKDSGFYRLSVGGPLIEGKPIFVDIPRDLPYDAEKKMFSLELKIWTSLKKFNASGTQIGHYVCPSWVIEAVFDALRIFPLDSAGPLAFSAAQPGFTEREWEIACLVAQGMSNKAAAGKLNITESTVKVHLKKIMRRLNAKNRVEVSVRLRTGVPTLSLVSREQERA